MLNKNVCVIGMGYIGLPTSILLASKNFTVYGFDKNLKVLENIKKHNVNFNEPGLKKLLKKTLNKKLILSSELKPSDIYIICVPTPVKKVNNNHKSDISMVMDCINKMKYFLKPKDTIIIESTCPPGTTKKIERILNDFLSFKNDLKIAYCPERILPGKILYELKNNDRIIGGINKKSSSFVKKFYSYICNGKIIICSETAAEIIKIAENSYRDLNIGFANSLSLICEKESQNVDEIIKLANYHPRVNILKPGIGVGGHCIPVDPWFLIEKYPNFTKQALETRNINNLKTSHVLKKIINYIWTFKKKYEHEPNILCLGLSYKENSDDLRGSPAFFIFKKLKIKFKGVTSFDPNIDVNLSKEEIIKLFSKADILIKLVNHKEFNKGPFKRLINQKNVLSF